MNKNLKTIRVVAKFFFAIGKWPPGSRFTTTPVVENLTIANAREGYGKGGDPINDVVRCFSARKY